MYIWHAIQGWLRHDVDYKFYLSFMTSTVSADTEHFVTTVSQTSADMQPTVSPASCNKQKRKQTRCRAPSGMKQDELKVWRRKRASTRELSRIHELRDSFTELRKHVPKSESDDKLSKLEVLRGAGQYIRVMREMLGIEVSDIESPLGLSDSSTATSSPQPCASSPEFDSADSIDCDRSSTMSSHDARDSTSSTTSVSSLSPSPLTLDHTTGSTSVFPSLSDSSLNGITDLYVTEDWNKSQGELWKDLNSPLSEKDMESFLQNLNLRNPTYLDDSLSSDVFDNASCDAYRHVSPYTPSVTSPLASACTSGGFPATHAAESNRRAAYTPYSLANSAVSCTADAKNRSSV